MTGPANRRIDLPKVGERAKLSRIVERFPHFWIAVGAAGTITEATVHLIALRMDEQISGAEEWDNELCWSLDDAGFYAGSPRQRMAAAFHADADLIGFDGTAGIDSTAKQQAGIAESKQNYAINPEVDLIGLRVLKNGDEFDGFPDDALIVEFTYRDADDDDPSGRTGREVTVFGADGKVLGSQDFG